MFVASESLCRASAVQMTISATQTVKWAGADGIVLEQSEFEGSLILNFTNVV
jgi:hypothetical protein